MLNNIVNILLLYIYTMRNLQEIAIRLIPDLLVPYNKPIINGNINDNYIKILIDTGASNSIIFMNTINSLNINDMIDYDVNIDLNCIGMKRKHKANGIIWYIEINIAGYLFPVALIVSNDNRMNKCIDIILGSNFLNKYNGVIDYKNKLLKLNDTIISFN